MAEVVEPGRDILYRDDDRDLTVQVIDDKVVSITCWSAFRVGGVDLLGKDRQAIERATQTELRAGPGIQAVFESADGLLTVIFDDGGRAVCLWISDYAGEDGIIDFGF